MDRGLERRPWRRPIPVGGVLIVLGGLLWLGMTSRLNDSRDATVAAQLAEQSQQEHAYFYSAFQPYSAPLPSENVASTSPDTTVAQGREFSILTAAMDATERAEAAPSDHR